MALPSEKDVCRRCGGQLEPGFIRGDAGNFNFIPSTIRWEAAGPGVLPLAFNDDTRLARLPYFRWQDSPRFPALLCPSCHIVEFWFTDWVHQVFP